MQELVIHGIYKHFKGKYYLVEDVALDSETQEEMVVYRKLYDDGGLWVRPKKMFLSEVDHEKYPDVKQKYRFELQEGLKESSCITKKPTNIVEYKGYYTIVSFDSETKKLRGKIEGIRDYVDFESESIENVEIDFRQAVDDYLLFCEEV